ncbi:MAG TPA: hypothetical protein PKH92_01150 [Anaerolineaceae bacterium]|jgi:hypothetical protein|nr:hypothetical protein [Longilinea sp.]HNR46238.1 hypothetical protein [Anaerolineaceae bacterium]HNS36698.1 hypothetical protein [Anaerolineaceae bacterium]HNZ12660.1 hypothetical protein [Anaerolineaceae bacterium]HOD03626.1 hypothetical protein [Anaerolineaceae bacterium]
MNLAQWGKIALMVVLTLVSGLGDSQGFIHAARVWTGSKFNWNEALLCLGGFTFGMIAYWFVIRLMNDFGITSPELQTIGWFAATIIGVALFSGDFFKWQRLDQGIAIAALVAVAWLVVRKGH